MPLQRINIDQQFSQIGIRGVSPARMQISTPRGQIRIQNTKPQLQIDTQMPTFRAPRLQINNESGLAGPLSFAKEFRNKGKQHAMQAIRNYAADGDFVANKNIPGDKSIPMLMANRMKRLFQSIDYNIGLMPSSPPSLEWTRGHIQVNATRHNIVIDYNGNNMADVSVENNYPVEVFLNRRPYFRVTSVEAAVTNSTYGRYIDRSV